MNGSNNNLNNNIPSLMMDVNSDVVRHLRSSFDATAAAYGVQLPELAYALLSGYVVSCTARLMAILAVLVTGCRTSSSSSSLVRTASAQHVQALIRLTPLFLDTTTEAASAMFRLQRKSKLRGGAETTLPGEFFGYDSGAYHAAESLPPTAVSQTSLASTTSLVRPAVPASMTGGADIQKSSEPLCLARAAFDLVVDALLKQKAAGEGIVAVDVGARAALQFIVDCNVLLLFGRLSKKSGTRSSRASTASRASKKVAMVTMRDLEAALRTHSFTIPV